jgi:hypothetical protein
LSTCHGVGDSGATRSAAKAAEHSQAAAAANVIGRQMAAIIEVSNRNPASKRRI